MLWGYSPPARCRTACLSYCARAAHSSKAAVYAALHQALCYAVLCRAVRLEQNFVQLNLNVLHYRT